MDDTNENSVKANIATILPFLPRTDVLPLNPADGEIWYFNPTNNIKIYIEGKGWGTTPVMFLPDDNKTNNVVA